MSTPSLHPSGSLKGTIYGDIIGSPYMIENTYNRYFDLGSTRRAFSKGRLRSFFPEVTEVSHGTSAVCYWLNVHRGNPTAESLIRCLSNQYYSHPRGGWTEPTRLFLTTENGVPSGTPDWSAVTRVMPIAPFFSDDLPRALELAEACVKATCSDPGTARVARALTQAVHMARSGCIAAEIFTRMEMEYGLNLTRPDDSLRAELRGEVRRPLEMMGTPVDGAWHYVLPESPAPPSARLVVEAAMQSVLRSDSWEDAVRRAVSLGGPSNAVAGIAGGLAEALYGEVTPTVVGRLFAYVPTDLAGQMDLFDDMSRTVRVNRYSSPYEGIEKDAVTLIRARPREDVFVAGEDSDRARSAVKASFPTVRIIAPSETEAYLAEFRDPRTGTFAYGPLPELITLYAQDGVIVPPERYVAPGMPSLQERRRHRDAFRTLRSLCLKVEDELNRAAGNPGAGQIHYEGAWHLWIGARKICFFKGDLLAGRITLDGKGLLRVDGGEYRDLSEGHRFKGHREEAWNSRALFTVKQCATPLACLDSIHETIRERLLDEGIGVGMASGGRELTEEERIDLSPVSNLDRLEPLEPTEPKGLLPEPEDIIFPRKKSSRAQEVTTFVSIGYGARSVDSFINTLQMLGVDTVVDIRSVPTSTFAPQFDSDPLWEALRQRKMDYFVAGDRLGERPDDPALYDAKGRVDWETLRHSGPFREGIKALEELARGGHSVAVVSAEGDPLISHRLGTVARTLSEDGFSITHVLPNGDSLTQDETESRLIGHASGKGWLSDSPSDSYSKLLDEAYRGLNLERGYRIRRRRHIPFSRKVKL